MAENSQPKWSALKPKLAAMKQPELIEIIKGLFGQSAENKLFLAMQLAPEAIGAAALEPYRKRIVAQFFPTRGFGKLNLRDARQAIRDYRKATSDMSGTLELMMTYLENGTEFTCDYGDINEAFYNSLETVLAEMAQILMARDSLPLYIEFSGRLESLAIQAKRVGWGYGDFVTEIVNNLNARWDEDETATSEE